MRGVTSENADMTMDYKAVIRFVALLGVLCALEVQCGEGPNPNRAPVAQPLKDRDEKESIFDKDEEEDDEEDEEEEREEEEEGKNQLPKVALNGGGRELPTPKMCVLCGRFEMWEVSKHLR